MKTLVEFIKESELKDNLRFKVDTWLRDHPDEKSCWDDALSQWNSTRQLDDEKVDNFINSTDIASFMDFMNDNVSGEGIRDDAFNTVKNLIKNYNN